MRLDCTVVASPEAISRVVGTHPVPDFLKHIVAQFLLPELRWPITRAGKSVAGRVHLMCCEI